ncbi:hypothetical protein FRC09_017959, partial [Ceratobasidium sp. 395]
MESLPSTSVLNHWKAARDNLEHATQTFADACTSFLQYIDESPVSHTGHRSIEDLIMTLHGQMKTVTAIESRMTKSKMMLRRIFNASTTLVPINNLPLEVLSRIFMLFVSSARCTADYPCDSYPPIVIAAVCSRWRHLAIITRSFWSHVDICELDMTSDSDPELTPRTRLCLERARDAPLWLHMSKPRGSWGTGSETLLLSLLTPYMTNVESMRFS